MPEVRGATAGRDGSVRVCADGFRRNNIHSVEGKRNRSFAFERRILDTNSGLKNCSGARDPAREFRNEFQVPFHIHIDRELKPAAESKMKMIRTRRFRKKFAEVQKQKAAPNTVMPAERKTNCFEKVVT